MTTPKIKAILPYFGGKRTIAPAIVEQLGPHACYWEPFCGSLAVILAKETSPSETVNDLNGDVTNLARVIASDDAPALFDRLQRTMFVERLALDAKASRTVGGQGAEAAYQFFLESWMGRNGVAGTRQSNTAFCVRYTNNGGDPATRFRSAVESIPVWFERLRNVTVLNRDGFDLLERIEDKEGTVVYADPPYIVKGAKYVHDFADADHSRLAMLLRRFVRARVVVSYYEHPRLNTLYADWTKRKIVVSKAMAHQGTRGQSNVTATEVLLINGPSYAKDDHPLFDAGGEA